MNLEIILYLHKHFHNVKLSNIFSVCKFISVFTLQTNPYISSFFFFLVCVCVRELNYRILVSVLKRLDKNEILSTGSTKMSTAVLTSFLRWKFAKKVYYRLVFTSFFSSKSWTYNCVECSLDVVHLKNGEQVNMHRLESHNKWNELRIESASFL